jgi:tRNA G18 (ribose-2'-O)-methylase SpoU
LAHPGRALALVCPGLNDSANVGLVIRSAVAFGATCILLGPGCADPYGRRSLRLSMGAALVAPLARYADAAAAERALQAAGYTLVGTANRADALPIMQARPPQRAAVFIGSEGAGLDPILLGRCDLVVRIPIEAGVDSLGASVAAGIALFWMSRAG